MYVHCILQWFSSSLSYTNEFISTVNIAVLCLCQRPKMCKGDIGIWECLDKPCLVFSCSLAKTFLLWCLVLEGVSTTSLLSQPFFYSSDSQITVHRQKHTVHVPAHGMLLLVLIKIHMETEGKYLKLAKQFQLPWHLCRF